jgi:hypothetical protein
MLPRPNENEPKKAFVNRCMQDNSMQGEFTDPSQRFAVCSCLFRTEEKKAAEAVIKKLNFNLEVKTLEMEDETDVEDEKKPLRRCAELIASTTTVDHEGEVIIAEGIDYSEYLSNPLVLLDHNFGQECGSAIKVQKSPNMLKATVEFPTKPDNYEGDWLPDEVWAKLTCSPPLLKAVSIGFIPTEQREPSKKDIATFGDNCKIVTSKCKLLEISIVTAGMNQDAMVYSVEEKKITEVPVAPVPVVVTATVTEPVVVPVTVEPVVTEPAPVPAPVQKMLTRRNGEWVLVPIEKNEPSQEDAVKKAISDAFNDALKKRLGKLYA